MSCQLPYNFLHLTLEVDLIMNLAGQFVLVMDQKMNELLYFPDNVIVFVQYKYNDNVCASFRKAFLFLSCVKFHVELCRQKIDRVE